MRPVAWLLLLASLAAACAPAGDDEEEASTQNLTESEASLAKLRDAVKNVDELHVVLGPDVKAPAETARDGANTGAASLFEIDWYQKWGGGKSADHDWANGSDYGKRCLWASLARFEAIMKDPPPEFVTFRAEYTKWPGEFHNRNDDYGGKSADGTPAFGDAKGARLWAWRTGVTKWVSATAKDGSCWLPTREMLVDYVKTCKEHLASNGDEMQGCEVSSLAK